MAEGQMDTSPDDERDVPVYAFPDDCRIRAHLKVIETCCVEAEPVFPIVWAFHADTYNVDQGHLLYTTFYPHVGDSATMPLLIAAHWLRNHEGLNCDPLRNTMSSARQMPLTFPRIAPTDMNSVLERVRKIYAEIDDMYINTLNPDAESPFTGTWFLALEIPLEVHQRLGNETRGRVLVLGEGESETYPALATIRDVLKTQFALTAPPPPPPPVANAPIRVEQEERVAQQRSNTTMTRAQMPVSHNDDGNDEEDDGEDLMGVSAENEYMDTLQDEVDALDDAYEPSDSHDAVDSSDT